MYEDLRKSSKAQIRCNDGHYVRSKSEKIIDDWLYNNNILHEYEPIIISKVNSNKFFFPDFFLKEEKIYIEYWGLNTKKYNERTKEKVAYYANNDIPFIGLNENDIMHLDDVLPRRIAERLKTKDMTFLPF